MSADMPAAPGAAAQAVHATLGACRSATACVTLAARVTQLAGGTYERVSRVEPVACREGCNFCCHLRVLVHPHEAVALAVSVGSRPGQEGDHLRRRLQSAAARMQALDPAEPVPTMPCAFLSEGRCSVYELRPAACALYHSLHRGACERRYETLGGRVGIPVSRALQEAAVRVHEEVAEGIAALGLSAARVELATGVTALLRAPHLIDTWLAGGAWERDRRSLVQGG